MKYIGKRVLRYINLKLGDVEDAKDLYIDVFEKIFINIEKFDPKKGSMDTWIFRIVRNEIANYYRKKKPDLHTLDEVQNMEEGKKSPIEIVVAKEEKKCLKIVMFVLNEKERLIIEYKYGAGLNNIEIAELMNISQSNVAVTIHLSMKKMKTQYDEKAV